MFACFYFGVFVVVMCYYMKYKWKRRRLEKMMESYNGPSTLPLIGNVEFYRNSSQALLEGLYHLAKCYKSRFRLWLANKPYLIIYNPQDFRIVANETLQKDGSYKFIADLLGDGIFTSEGDKWKRHRRLITPYFQPNSMLREYLKIFNENNLKLIDRLKKKVGTGRHFDLWPNFMYTSLTTFCETSMGYGNLDKDQAITFGKAMKITAKLVSQRFISIWLMPSIIFQVYKHLFGYKNQFHIVTDLPLQLLEKRKQLYHQINETRNFFATENDDEDVSEINNKTRRFVDKLLDFEKTNVNFTKTNLYDEVTSIVFGGSETSAVTNCYTLLMLGMNQNVQEKVYQEIAAIFGDSNRLPELEDLSRLPYLEQCIKETLRMFPAVPMIFRYTPKDIFINHGNVIPAGANVCLFIYALHRNPDLYPNPDIWNPGNFDTDKVAGRHSASFVPFSLGPRKCIGEKYAMAVMKAELSTLLRNFKVSTDLTIQEIQFEYDLILRSRNGYHVKLEYRHGKSLF